VTDRDVLVTGAAGFIGSHVAGALLAAGRTVVGIDNFDPFYDRAVKESALRDLHAARGFTFLELDVRDRDRLRSILAGVSAVVHLAARPGVRQSVERPWVYRDVNEGGTRSVLKACAAAGVRRVVFVSSSSVYGAGAESPFREDATLGPPTSPYAATKQAGERMVQAFVRDGGGRAAIVRLFSVYGPRQRPDLALHLFARRLASGLPVPILGDGGSRRDYTHVADVARGIVAALDWTRAPDAACEAFNLGAGHPVRLDWLVAEVARCLGVEVRLDVRPPHPADLPVTWADPARARAVLGFVPQIPLTAGVAEFVAWFEREHGRQPCPAA
jgi:UDP-glucuronate 4-epimerase